MEIGVNLLKLFLTDSELEWLESIKEDDNPYRIARELDTEVE